MKEKITAPTILLDTETGEIKHYLDKHNTIKIMSDEEDSNNQNLPYIKVISMQGAFNKFMKDLEWIEEFKNNTKLIYIILTLSKYLEAETNYLKTIKGEYLGRKHFVKLFNISESLASRYIHILRDKEILAYMKDKDGVKCLCFNPRYIYNGKGVIQATLSEFKKKDKKEKK